jgi:dihydroorotate dehydrogenase electron transfer subunit
MYRVFQICEKKSMNLQASLERIMRCGCGLCGLCSIDPLGLLVCRDGPIFKSEILRKLEDFGKYKRDFTGKKIKI